MPLRGVARPVDVLQEERDAELARRLAEVGCRSPPPTHTCTRTHPPHPRAPPRFAALFPGGPATGRGRMPLTYVRAGVQESESDDTADGAVTASGSTAPSKLYKKKKKKSALPPSRITRVMLTKRAAARSLLWTTTRVRCSAPSAQKGSAILRVGRWCVRAGRKANRQRSTSCSKQRRTSATWRRWRRSRHTLTLYLSFCTLCAVITCGDGGHLWRRICR